MAELTLECVDLSSQRDHLPAQLSDRQAEGIGERRRRKGYRYLSQIRDALVVGYRFGAGRNRGPQTRIFGLRHMISRLRNADGGCHLALRRKRPRLLRTAEKAGLPSLRAALRFRVVPCNPLPREVVECGEVASMGLGCLHRPLCPRSRVGCRAATLVATRHLPGGRCQSFPEDHPRASGTALAVAPPTRRPRQRRPRSRPTRCSLAGRPDQDGGDRRETSTASRSGPPASPTPRPPAR